jgi:crotonobetainyl-CoA:carnitine CoA-transferase CaiB-like acyl-CoA transferase
MVRTAEEVDRLLVAAGREDLLTDPRFADPAARLANGDAFVELLREVFRARTAPDWMQTFREHAVPISVVTHVQDLPDDAQLLANEIVTPPANPAMPSPPLINHPVNVRDLPRVGPTPAPDLGQHSDEILTELGYADMEIAQLRHQGIV